MQVLDNLKYKNFLNNISVFKTVFVLNLFLQSFIFLDAVCCIIDAFILIWSLFFLKNFFLKNSFLNAGIKSFGIDLSYIEPNLNYLTQVIRAFNNNVYMSSVNKFNFERKLK